ncbi:MAG: HigA family addiction module antitoxin [Treponema sp.]|nr:HigA family addiction module antitoxin [Treponema sp.]
MQKNTQTPGSVIQGLLGKHGLNCNRLAKAINMSNAMVRLLILDKSPISVSAAYRLAKFFKTKPAYWLNLQMEYDLAEADGDKELAKQVSAIVEVSEYEFVRKPHGSQQGKAKEGKKKEAAPPPPAKRKAAEKAPPAKKGGRKPAGK